MSTDTAPRYWAVMPAAGGGTRMGQARPKQYLALKGKALIEWSLGALLNCGWVDGIVVVLAKSDQEFAALPTAGHPKLVITTGGAARADSVLAGLKAVAARTRGFETVHVLVHDAARPCLEVSSIEQLVEESDEKHGGLLALPSTDTLKRGKQSGGAARVVETVDRAFYWRAQTPQLFRLDLLTQALDECRARDIEITDEASAMERAGYHPRLVRGRESNIKVTYPEDLALAEFWLSRRERPA
jgi:2-C-methyl-D-erythritol 4-phosphate cytidylyltransferase